MNWRTFLFCWLVEVFNTGDIITGSPEVTYNLGLVQPVNYIPTITNFTQLWWVPNVVVAHQEEGIEAVHLASGRTVCKVLMEVSGYRALTH